MQTLIIAGNVGKDAKLRQTSGDDVLSFTLAVSNGKDKDGNERPPTWYDCSVWGKRASALEQYVTKGTKLCLRGRPTAREYEGKAYLGITVDDLTFMGRSGEGSGGSRRERDEEGTSERTSKPKAGQQSLDDEIPF